MQTVELNLSDLLSPIQAELIQVEQALKSVGGIQTPLVAQAIEYLFQQGGKRLRPAVVLLTARFGQVELDRKIILAAAMETLHTATLVHDDMIDKSATRRGHPTINSLWGHGATVLAGDYLFARAASFAAATGNIRVVELFSEVLMTIVDGELNQMIKAGGIPTEEEYYQRIYGKTASLFAASTETAAALCGINQEQSAHLYDYGYNLGLAFQIIDDVLDFTSTEEELGKPVGSDLLSGNITLPVIIYLREHPEETILWQILGNKGQEEELQRWVTLIRDSDAPQKASAQARHFIERAQTALEALPPLPERQVMHDLAEYIIERRR